MQALDSHRRLPGPTLQGRFSTREKIAVDKALEALGSANIDRLVEGGVTLKLRDAYETESTSYTAMYLPNSKTLVMSSSRMDKETLIHEFAHALDDLAAPDPDGEAVLRSELDEDLQQLHQDYKERVESLPWYNRFFNFGGGLWSDYATTNPQEYLAEGVRLYASSESGRRQLERDDPKLAEYVETFLRPNSPSEELGMLLVA